jgi:hypothetical protein
MNLDFRKRPMPMKRMMEAAKTVVENISLVATKSANFLPNMVLNSDC